MAQRYTKSVTTVLTSDPDTTSCYGTRNKRRKLNESTKAPISRRRQSPPRSGAQYGAKSTPESFDTGGAPMYSRNLDKALKSILSENPRSRGSRGRISVEITSAEEEVSSHSAPGGQENRQTPSMSVSSQSRETTPASSEVIEVPPFITFFQ